MVCWPALKKKKRGEKRKEREQKSYVFACCGGHVIEYPIVINARKLDLYVRTSHAVVYKYSLECDDSILLVKYERYISIRLISRPMTWK